MPKCEHGLTSKECYVCASPKHGAKPERHFCERCGKRLSQDGIHTCTPPQQAEPVEPRRWEGDHNIESPFNACMHKSYCITLKQALAQRKPLSEEEIERICMTYQSPRQAARAIERAHGIGDNT